MEQTASRRMRIGLRQTVRLRAQFSFSVLVPAEDGGKIPLPERTALTVVEIVRLWGACPRDLTQTSPQARSRIKYRCIAFRDGCRVEMFRLMEAGGMVIGQSPFDEEK